MTDDRKQTNMDLTWKRPALKPSDLRWAKMHARRTFWYDLGENVPRRCTRHRRRRSPMSPFVPQDMTPSEKSLLATITAQTIALRAATTPDEIAAAHSEAEQTAGEMIWAQRAELTAPEPELPMEGWTAQYYEHLAANARADREMFDAIEEETTRNRETDQDG